MEKTRKSRSIIVTLLGKTTMNQQLILIQGKMPSKTIYLILLK